MNEHEFQLEVVDRLARIETKVDAAHEAFAAHVVDNEQQFSTMEASLRDVTIDHEVAKRAGRVEGRKTGAKWAAAISTGLLVLAEIARAWVG